MAEGSERPEDLSRTVLGGSDFCYEFYCYPCHEDGRDLEAFGYCQNCGDYLCDECYRSHRRSKPSRHHVLLDSKNMPKDLTSSQRVLQTDITPRTTGDKYKNSAVNVQHKGVNARHIADIKLKSKFYSKKSNVTGLAILSEGKLVAIEGTNKKIKVIDTIKHKVIYEFKLESEPWDVSSVDRNNIVITLPDVGKIQYLNVFADGTVSINRTVNVDGECWGIAFARDTLLVSYTSPGKLEALTLDGEVLLCISTDDSGNYIFPDPQYVALSPAMETIYVSDFNKESVIRLSSSGKLLSECNLEYPPTGVAVAADGTVYTCSGGSVYMLTAECEMIKKLLDKDQAGYAQSIAYDNDVKQLIVGYCDSDIIKIFQLTGF